jgi:hypothetical protein
MSNMSINCCPRHGLQNGNRRNILDQASASFRDIAQGELFVVRKSSTKTPPTHTSPTKMESVR